jgi:hypothetical protein
MKAKQQEKQYYFVSYHPFYSTLFYLCHKGEDKSVCIIFACKDKNLI